jgi:hypothetical protein
MDENLRNKISEVIKLCNEKIRDQKLRESGVGYVEDYNDGRVVGGAALARRILELLKDVSW